MNRQLFKIRRNEESFWNTMYNKVHGENIQVSRSSETISFDFKTEDALNEKINYINSLSFLNVTDFGKDHKYKFKITFKIGLQELNAKLKNAFPNLNAKISANGEKIIFRQFYQTGNKAEVLARLRNQFESFIDTKAFSYTIPSSHIFQEKYLCEEMFSVKIEQEEEG